MPSRGGEGHREANPNTEREREGPGIKVRQEQVTDTQLSTQRDCLRRDKGGFIWAPNWKVLIYRVN